MPRGTRGKILVAIVVALIVAIFIAANSTKAPAEVSRSEGAFAALARHAAAVPHGEGIVLFCVESTDAEIVADALKESGNEAAVVAADELVRNRRCARLIELTFDTSREVCKRYPSEACIGVQPSVAVDVSVDNGKPLNGFIVTTTGRSEGFASENTVWARIEP